MQFTAEHYYRTARERISEAAVLYERQRCGLSMYISGLSVECLLRAFRSRKDPFFDSRHDLRVLFRDSGILRLHDDRLERLGLDFDGIRRVIAEFRAAHDVVIRHWRNDIRIAAERHIRAWLNTIGAYHGIKGDVLKESSRRLLVAAKTLVNTGVDIWTSKKK